MILATIKALFDIVLLCLDCAGAFGSHETVDPRTGKRRKKKKDDGQKEKLLESGQGRQSLEDAFLNPLQGQEGGDAITLLHSPADTKNNSNHHTSSSSTSK